MGDRLLRDLTLALFLCFVTTLMYIGMVYVFTQLFHMGDVVFWVLVAFGLIVDTIFWRFALTNLLSASAGDDNSGIEWEETY